VLNFTFDALDQAKASVDRIKDFLYELGNRSFPAGNNPLVTKMISATQKKFIEGLGDDLNISVALTALFELIKEANILIMHNKLFGGDAEALSNLVYTLDRALAVLPPKQEAALEAEVLERIQLREKARADKDYALADRIRQELLQAGVVLEDTKEGVRWKVIKIK